jgi:hypothetical protein
MSTRPLLVSLVVAAGLVSAFAACTSTTDLGEPCILVKKNPDTSSSVQSVPITAKEITPGKDFISFGAVECEDLVCVLDAEHTSQIDPDGGNPDAPVTGYCSRSCVPGSSTACAPQKDTANDSNPDTSMSCRALLLDPATLGRICQADPAKCQQYFGNNSSPYFCARGGEPDAGP